MGIRLNCPIRTEPPDMTHLPIYLQSPLNRALICLGQVNMFLRIRSLQLEALLISLGQCRNWELLPTSGVHRSHAKGPSD
jgi:hypothetical protein